MFCVGWKDQFWPLACLLCPTSRLQKQLEHFFSLLHGCNDVTQHLTAYLIQPLWGYVLICLFIWNMSHFKWTYTQRSKVPSLPCLNPLLLLTSDTRWLSELRVLLGDGLFLVLVQASEMHILFVNNASRHLGYEYTDMSPSFMFWCLNLPALRLFHEVSNNGLNTLSSEEVSHRCTHAEVKGHLSLFKNKLYAMSFSIYAPHV